jgi:hypothetical protein
MARRLQSGPVEGELARLRKHALGVHSAETLRLPVLREVLENYEVWTPGPGGGFGDALVAHLTAVIADLELTAGQRSALRIDLALDFKPDAVPPQPKRGEEAAIAADCRYETYRHNRADQIGVRKHIFRRLATELDPDGRTAGTSRSKLTSRVAAVPKATEHGAAHYHPLQLEDLESGLWWRPSTRDYIEQLASQPALTIFAGTDGVADVGPPLHADVMLLMLRDCLNDEPLLAHLEKKARDTAADDLVSAVRASGARGSYIGSIVRGLWDARDEWSPDQIEARLHNVVQVAGHGRGPGGFVSGAITRLAFALRARNRDVNVVSAHYDGDLAAAAAEIHKRHPELAGCSYLPLIAELPSDGPGSGKVPLVMLNGHQSGPHAGGLVIGEADAVSKGVDPAGAARVPLLEELFVGSSVVLAGTSLTEPGILTAMARTRGGPHPRFALLPSPIPEDMPPGAVIAGEKRAEVLALLAARYLHLDIVPIVVDFRYQVPQLLTEVARRTVEGDRYAGYAARIESWWSAWADAFGFGAGGDGSAARALTQSDWHAQLRTLRDTMMRTISRPSRAEAEDVMIEVWLRDPRPDSRRFFRWASSEGTWERSKTTPVASLREVGDITQKAFRDGQTYTQEMGHGDLGRWRYCVAMNLTLTEGPWADLPVGIVKVYSTQPKGGVQQSKDGASGTEFESSIVNSLRRLLSDAA